MTPVPTVKLLLRNWLIIAVATLVAGVAGFIFSRAQTPSYTATSAQYFSVAVGQTGAGLGQSSSYIQDQMPSFNQLAKSPLVLNPVIDALQLDTTYKALARMVVVTTARDSVVMEIAVVAPDPVLAARIANATGSELADAVGIVGPKAANGSPLISVQSIQTALPAAFPFSPNTKRNTAIGLLAGLILGCALVLARAHLDKTVRTPQTLGELTDAPLLGSMRRAEGMEPSHLLVLNEADSDGAEDIRRIRSSVEQMSAGKASLVLAVTSAIRSEGRSSIAANLAGALAEAGRRTVLIEADLRHPTLSTLKSGGGPDSKDGLITALRDGAAIPRVLQTADGPTFSLIAAGGTSSNPTPLLASPNMKALLSWLREHYEFVLVDTPALLESADATVLSSQVDGAVMVVDGRRAQQDQVQTALASARLAGLEVMGVVLNLIPEGQIPSTHTRRPRGKTVPLVATDHPAWELPSRREPVTDV